MTDRETVVGSRQNNTYPTTAGSVKAGFNYAKGLQSLGAYYRYNPERGDFAMTVQNGLTATHLCFAVSTEKSVRIAIWHRCIMKMLLPTTTCCILTVISGNRAIRVAWQRRIRNLQILMSIQLIYASQPFGQVNYTLNSRLERELHCRHTRRLRTYLTRLSHAERTGEPIHPFFTDGCQADVCRLVYIVGTDIRQTLSFYGGKI